MAVSVVSVAAMMAKATHMREQNQAGTPKPVAGKKCHAANTLSEGQESGTHTGRARARP